MTDPVHKIEEKIVELEREAERGESERTPWIVLGGIQIAAHRGRRGRARARLHGVSACVIRFAE